MWENLFVVTTQFATNVQLKDLKVLSFNLISQTILKKGVFFCVLTLKYMYQFWMSSKKFNPRQKT